MTMRSRLREILSGSRQRKVLVIGDLILDEYISGIVKGISPEAPVQVIEPVTEDRLPGAAANVASNLKALDCEVYLCGAVGNDENGRQLLNILKEKGIHTEGVMIDPSRTTTLKTRLISQNQHILRIDREVRHSISGVVSNEAGRYLRRIIPEMDGIICSDYQKGFLVDRLLEEVIHCARINGIKVAVDPKGAKFSRYRGVGVLTPNLKELKQASPFNVVNEREMDLAVQYIFQITQGHALLLTRGKGGMTLYEKGADKVHIPADVQEVYDVAGAGDTVISVFALGYFSDAKLADAASLANEAAGIVVNRVGTSTVSRKELMQCLSNDSNFSEKIIDCNQLSQFSKYIHSQDLRIIFTNGCFDLLHVGHIQFLQAAKKKGGLLVVGINNDQSVRDIKGPGRPIITEMDRARILAALDCVDYVVLFSEPTPMRLIADLLPDVLVKGDDYSVEEVVGREFVEGYGGRVELISLVPGLSTSRIVDSIIERNSKKL
jgi:D-beta-D-heptose 7-phosphate kinase / D-beta-D-heptose 1-phosphate adenosyltransferase